MEKENKKALSTCKLQKDYTLNQSGYQLKLPLELETIIPKNDSVRLLSQFVEEMDLTDLYKRYQFHVSFRRTFCT